MEVVSYSIYEDKLASESSVLHFFQKAIVKSRDVSTWLIL